MPGSERAWRFRLEHILEALDKIQTYTRDFDFEGFASDTRTVDATLRNLAVIGEATRHLPDELLESHPEVPWGEMRGLRNILIHEYFGVSLSIVWTTVQRDLPPLRDQIHAIMETLPSTE